MATPLHHRLHQTPLTAYLKTTGALLALGLGFKALGALQQAVLAMLFGAGPELDAYFAAIALPNLLIVFFVLGPIGLALTSPVLRQAQDERVMPVVRAVATLGLLASLGLACLGYLAAPAIISFLAPGFAPETALLSADLFRIVVPAIVLATLGSLARSILHAYQRFLVPMIAYGAGSLALLTALVLLNGPLGVHAAAIGMVTGAAVSLLVQWLWLRREHVTLGPAWPVQIKGVLSIIGPLCLLGLALAAFQGAALWGRFYASHLGPGNLALLDYALSLDKLVGGLVAGSAAAAAYPTILAQAREGLRAAEAGVLRALRGSLLTALPLVALVTVLREPLLYLWLERGRFLPEDTAAVAELVLLLAPAFVAWSMAYPLLYAAHALGRLRIPLLMALIGFCAAGAAGPVLLQLWALKGVAAGVSLSVCLSAALVFGAIARELPGLWGPQTAVFLGKLVVSIALAAIAAGLPTGLPPIGALVLGVGLGGAVYLGSLRLLGVTEAVEAWTWVWGRIVAGGGRERGS